MSASDPSALLVYEDLERTLFDRPAELAKLRAYRTLVEAPAAAAIPEPIRLGTNEDLQQLLGVCARTIDAMRADGRIPEDAVIKIGRRGVRYDVAKVIDALRGKRAASAESKAASWARRVGSLKVVNGGSQ